MASKKNDISAAPENIGKKHHLQKLIYYTTDFNQTLTRMMKVWLVTNALYRLTSKM